MVLPVHVGFCDHKDIVKKQLAEIGKMVSFPVLDSRVQAFYGLLVFGSTLSFVDFVRDALCSIRTRLQLGIMLIILGIACFEERLQAALEVTIQCRSSAYIQEQWVFAYSLDRLDEKGG